MSETSETKPDPLTREEAMSFLARAMRLVEAMCADGRSFPDHEDPIDLVDEIMRRLDVADPKDLFESLS